MSVFLLGVRLFIHSKQCSSLSINICISEYSQMCCKMSLSCRLPGRVTGFSRWSPIGSVTGICSCVLNIEKTQRLMSLITNISGTSVLFAPCSSHLKVALELQIVGQILAERSITYPFYFVNSLTTILHNAQSVSTSAVTTDRWHQGCFVTTSVTPGSLCRRRHPRPVRTSTRAGDAATARRPLSTPSRRRRCRSFGWLDDVTDAPGDAEQRKREAGGRIVCLVTGSRAGILASGWLNSVTRLNWM